MTFFTERNASTGRVLNYVLNILAVGVALAFFAAPASAQQTGDIAGQVIDQSGNGIGGVAIEARSNILPAPRSTTSADNGHYRLRLLPPGNYEVKFTHSDGSSQVRAVFVALQQTADLDVVRNQVMDEIVVTGEQLSAAVGQGSLSNSLSADTIDAIPTGQDYRDLMRLIPGVQVTQMSVRGPSAGGSGQDNVYQFDGVDVSLPLFGVLGSEPSSHDIEQVVVVRGGAKAIGFNRSGGFTMNTISKRGSDEFKAEIEYQLQSSGMTGKQEQDTASALVYDQDRTWVSANFGGPLIKDRLYFYTSYYRPERTRKNSENAYGPVGDYDSLREEYFGKLTFSLTDDITLDASYRTSDREVQNRSIGAFEAPTVSVGDNATQDILILEGSWILGNDNGLSFKYIDWEETGTSRPDTIFDFVPQQGGSLNLGALDTMGYIDVPVYRDEITQEDIDFNNFLAPIVNAYSHDVVGGGGAVGGYHQIDSSQYLRESFELAYDHTLYTGDMTHDLHVGYKWEDVGEDLARRSNGWGLIEIPGGLVQSPTLGEDVFFQARVQQQSLLSAGGEELIPSIFSSSEMQSIEINDTISRGDWTYNIGVMISNDVLYGQGLRPNANNPVTGFELSPGHPYKMYEVDWKDMLQPRLGASWDYNDTGMVYANYARYHPAASSLARAASWDRNLRSRIDVYFDANGDFIESETVDSSSGKWFQAGIKPRHTDEFLIGTTQEFSDELTFRAHVRHRKSENFWEDTWNWSRQYDTVPGAAPDTIPNEPYIPDDEFAALRDEIGGSTYVIAALDGAFTKYWEASMEIEWQRDDWYMNGSYTWSHYYGNFDQDNTSGGNDAALFIGSSNLADGRGRQLWDLKEGNLKGDRRHMFKLWGYYHLPWTARAGAFLMYQSGEPWETWDGSYYGYSSSTIRYSETAGTHNGPSHWQLDLNYTHDFAIGDSHGIQLRADLYNVFDEQTGYNFDPYVSNSGYGAARSYYRPRLLQLQVKYQFN